MKKEKITRKRMSKKRKIILSIVITIISLVVVFFLWNGLQYSAFFHPNHDSESYQQLKQIEDMREIKIKNKDVNLSGWFWNRKGDKAPLIIFFQGNAQNSSRNMFQYYSSKELQDMLGEYNILIVDYPGYGLSSGKPSDDSMFIASDYIFDTAKNMQEVDPDNIVIMGYSIGTGVATYCASQHDAKGLILVAPYDKALSLYNDSVNSFYGPVESLAKYSFDSATYAKDVKNPVFIITSKADEVINYQHSLNLSEQFSDLEDVLILEGVDHNSYFCQATVMDKIGEFLKNRLN